jgi:hypothetical protein
MPIRRRGAPIGRILLLLVAIVPAAACSEGGRRFNPQYEYEEDVTLSVDGSAIVVINSSIAALVALHDVRLPVDNRTRIDRSQVRAAFESAVTDVTRVSRTWRRRGRRFVQIRLTVDDIRRLPEARPFAESRYELASDDTRIIYKQRVSGGKRAGVPAANWNGSELVAFKLHVPSRVFYHNVRDLQTNEPGRVERGNILRWEQRLSDRLAGVPLELEVRMDRESILFRTLWLFAGAFGAAMAMLVGAIWLVVRRGRRATAPRSSQSPLQS